MKAPEMQSQTLNNMPFSRGAVLAALFASSLIFSRLHAATVEEWVRDLEKIQETLRLQHPNAFTKLGPAAFDERLDSLKTDIPRLSEEERTVKAMQIIAALGDGHTQLQPYGEAFSWWYPFRLYEFTDGYYITSAHKSVAPLLGAQVLEMGGMPVSAAVDKARELMGGDNSFDQLENLHPIENSGLAKGLHLADSSGLLKIKVRTRENKVVETTLTPLKGDSKLDWRFRSEVFGPYAIKDWLSVFGGVPNDQFKVTDPKRPLHLRNRYFYNSVSIPEKSAYYIQVDFVQNKPDEDLVSFFKRSLKEVDASHPKYLIIDFRYNSGGDGSMAIPVIEEFVKRKDSPPWQQLFFLTGRKTFSASLMFYQAFVEHTQVTFVGEPAGASPTFFGDAFPTQFEKTQLELEVSSLLHRPFDAYKPRIHTQVDVPAQFSFADYVAGKDAAIDSILAATEMRALSLIVLSDGGSAARKTYEERKKRFGDLPWWLPADEGKMNKAGYELLRRKQVPDAVEAFQLNADIHPTSWRVWDSLAEAQVASGMKEKGIQNYHKSAEIFPGNSNAQMMLRQLEGK